jgi:hypothetical protein
MTLATMRAAVRQDLHDEDATAYRWTDAVLQRHIEHALRDYSLVSPLETKTVKTTTTGSRDIDISALTPRVRIIAAEWPTGAYPETFVPFRLFGDTLTLDVVGAPSSVQNVNVFWHKGHTINGSTTFPATHDDIIATGAAGYAALDRSVFASDRVNVGGDAWGRYSHWGAERLEKFKQLLRDLPASSRVQSFQLYTPDDVRLRSQTTDPGPQ